MSNAKVTFEDEGYEAAAPGKEVRFSFNCPLHDRHCSGLLIMGKTQLKHDPQNQNGGIAQWSWDGDREHPTFMPSINCLGCWHGFIIRGRCLDVNKAEMPNIVRART